MPVTPALPGCTSANALLLLGDGTVFYGAGIGRIGQTAGELCFNTAMTGYQEILTDPSYAGQIITFTFPHIGNVGANDEDIEGHVPHAHGLVLREDITEPSNFRSAQHLQRWLEHHDITGICGIDTRALTLHLRQHGAQNGLILHVPAGEALPAPEALQAKLAEAPSLDGLELAESVSTVENYNWTQRIWRLEGGYGGEPSPLVGEGRVREPVGEVESHCDRPLTPTLSHEGRGSIAHVVAIDFGEKLNILRLLADHGCRLTVVPARTPAAEILALNPDGIFLSNGPGDPAATGAYAIATIATLLEANVPIFGICLGHQLLALAMGCKTAKMHQGHRGANHPVQHLGSGKVEITSQNHGFSVVPESIPDDVEVTHKSLFDGCIEGLRHKTKPAFCVQYHPESSPGPHDSWYLFEEFVAIMEHRP